MFIFLKDNIITIMSVPFVFTFLYRFYFGLVKMPVKKSTVISHSRSFDVFHNRNKYYEVKFKVLLSYILGYYKKMSTVNNQ